MQSIVQPLRQLININRKILNKLHKDEGSIEGLDEAFNERDVHIRKINGVIPEVKEQSLDENDRASLNALFERFAQQSEKIQDALDYIMDETKNELGKAIKRRKAEEGYRVLK